MNIHRCDDLLRQISKNIKSQPNAEVDLIQTITRISNLSEMVVKWSEAPWPLVPEEMRAARKQQRLTDVERYLAKPWFDWSTTLTSNVQGYIEWKATLPQTRRARHTVGWWFGGVPQSMSIQRALTAFTSVILFFFSSTILIHYIKLVASTSVMLFFLFFSSTILIHYSTLTAFTSVFFIHCRITTHWIHTLYYICLYRHWNLLLLLQ